MPVTRHLLAAVRHCAPRLGRLQPVATSRSLHAVRSVALSPQTQMHSKSSKVDEEEEEVVNNEPIKFSSSKASHRVWTVSKSMGSDFQRPYWKVLSLSMVCCSILLWCVFRTPTEIDEQLDRYLGEIFPGLTLEQDNVDDKKKSS